MDNTKTIFGAVIPLMRANINTDIIMPQTELVTVSKKNLGKGIFARWRYNPDGTPNVDFVLNQSKYKDGKILISDENFGCGSSREHAVWGILDYGIQCIIAPSFAEIFRDNAQRNKLLLIEIARNKLLPLVNEIENTTNEYFISIDLVNLQIKKNTDLKLNFYLSKKEREYFLSNEDYIDNTLDNIKDIIMFQQQDMKKRPWIYLHE